MTEELKNEQTVTEKAHAAEAEEVKGAENGTASYGKFKDADALYAAYNSLQAEFTRRCQRLKELEAKSADAADKDKAGEEKNASDAEKFFNADPVPESDNRDDDAKDKAAAEKAKEEILKEYLRGIMERKTGAIIMDGAGASLKTARVRPKTVEEAGKLFRDFIG